MKFGPVPTIAAAGATLAHTLHAGDRVLKKGRILVAADLDALLAAGFHEITVARIEPGELDEDAAAAAVAAAVAGDHVRFDSATTGRANLFADTGGLVVVAPARIHALNARDEAITCATLPPLSPVRRGDMIATVKIIPFAVARDIVAAAAVAGRSAVGLQPWRGIRAGLVMTHIDGLHEPRRAADVQRQRLASAGGALVAERSCAHDAPAVAAMIRELLAMGLELVLVLGASAVMDRDDVVPAAIRAAGGEVLRVGMPVDPGNLLVLGHAGAAAIIGVPGCARSPKRSGFDAVLERIAAGVPVARDDLAAMGVGGLLEDVAQRPQPRNAGGDDRIAAIVLAAGKSTRMGANKLLADVDGRPIVRHVVEAALGSRARPVVVVTGNEPDAIRNALAGLAVTFVHNADHAAGMSTSLRAGVAALDADVTGMLVCLADMPRIGAGHLDAIIDAARDVQIVVPTHERKRGHPVLLRRSVFADVLALEGDVGARAVIERHAEHAGRVRWLPIDDPAILVDVDTPGALDAVRVGQLTPHGQ